MTSANRYLGWPSVITMLCLSAALLGPLAVLATPEQVQKLMADGRLDQALAMTNSELAADNDNVTYRFLKGLILTRQEKLEQARDVFVDITRTNPELPEPYNNLAVIHAALGDFDAARLALEKAINTHPAYATAYENIGDIYAKLASQAYNQALELDRDNNTAKAKLSLVNDLFSLPTAPAVTPAPAVAASGSSGDNAPAVAVVAARVDNAVEPPPPVAVPVREVPAPPVQTARVESVDTSAQEEPARAAAAVREPATEVPVQVARVEQSPVAIIKQTVIDWSSAWSAQDVNAYLAFYASDFIPQDGRPIAQWRDLRRQRLSQPGTIRVTIADLVVEMNGAMNATATFTQSYQSDSYSDRVKKTLVLKLENDRWLIVREQA